jgi:hypothetical protein
MNFAPLPDDWPAQRDTMRRVATHVVAQAQQRETGHFALMALPGGFGTPQFGAQRTRVRVVGGSLVVERADGQRDGERTATTDVLTIAGSSIRALCAGIGFEPDPDLSVGGDTPPPGDLDEPLSLDSIVAAILGDWYGLGQRAMDDAVASLPDAQASVVRLWPEHFDVGIDLAADAARKPDVRVNLGASAGDGSHQEPYVYVGPWGDERPGPSDYWNAPFGAVLSFAELDAADNPLSRASEFLLQGIAALRM